jgi:hypothetical protein
MILIWTYRFFRSNSGFPSKKTIVLLGTDPYNEHHGLTGRKPITLDNHEVFMSNYTENMVAKLTAAAPISFTDAEKFASEFNLSKQSIIAKTKSLGLEYIPQARPAKRAKGLTKADLVASIEKKLSANLDGLELAKATALASLLDALQS